MEENDEDEEKEDEQEIKKKPLYAAADHANMFDPDAYLSGFYKKAGDDLAMKIALFFLPGMLYRIPEKIDTLLDLGAGPTIYIPVAFRHRAANIYTSDYAEANRKALLSWVKGEHGFDWTAICEWLASIEATMESPQAMLSNTRAKMRAILNVDVHKTPVVQDSITLSTSEDNLPKHFQVVATIFCLEYASENIEEYRRAVKSAVSLIRPGGYLLQGGVLHAKEYYFASRRFRCHCLTESEMLSCLKENGMTTQGDQFKLITYEDIFLLLSKKSGAEIEERGGARFSEADSDRKKTDA